MEFPRLTESLSGISMPVFGHNPEGGFMLEALLLG